MRPVLWRIFKEGWFPLVFALGASAYSYQSGREFGELSATFSYVFFIVFFFQGQVFRIKKNVRDDNNAEFSRTMLTDIHQVVAEINSQRNEQPLANATERLTPPARHDPGRTREGFRPPPLSSTGPGPLELGSAEMFAEAEQSLAQGLNSGASLLAAVAFEKAIREIASRIDVSYRQPLSRIVDEMELRCENPSLMRELRTLIRFRNGLVHAQNQASLFSDNDASETVNLFRSAVDRLTRYYRDEFLRPRSIQG